MNKKRIVVLAGVAIGLLLLAGLAGATAVLAQDPTPPAEADLPGGMMGPGRDGFWFGGPGHDWTAFDAAADALGLTPVELFTELHSGKTLAEIADEQGVDLETVQEAVRAARVEAMRARIQQAVEDGTMSQEEADWLLEGLEKGYGWRGLGWRGFGRGFGGRGGCPRIGGK